MSISEVFTQSCKFLIVFPLPGVRHVLKSLLAEFDILMEEAGFQSIEQINRSAIDSLPNSSNLIAERAGI